nr:hypothetical protein [Sunxiuqinia sp.]
MLRQITKTTLRNPAYIGKNLANTSLAAFPILEHARKRIGSSHVPGF